MTAASTARNMSPRLLGVMERAKNPSYRFNSLAHLIDEGALERAFRRLDGRSAEGGDGVTKAHYGEALGERLGELHTKLREGRWRHQPILRVLSKKDSMSTSRMYATGSRNSASFRGASRLGLG
jgi:hypothetical protein